MKYHNTKTTVVTIFVVMFSLFMVSALGILYLNAKTPVEAVSNALFQNLELPSDYSVEITDINQSFLKNQKIDNVSIKKGDDTFISMDDVELNQSIVAYIKLFFHRQKSFSLKVGNMDVNFNENFNDISSGLTGLKIKDNTFSNQNNEIAVNDSEKEGFDYSKFKADINRNGSVDLKPFIPSILKNMMFDLQINKGSINYLMDSIKISSKFEDLKININDETNLQSITANLSDIVFETESITFSLDKVSMDLNKTNLNIDCYDMKFSQTPIVFDLDELELSYSLLNMESAVLDYNNLSGIYNDYVMSISRGQTKIFSNLKDYSIYNSLEDINLLNDDFSVDMDSLDVNASYVDDKTSIVLTSGDNNYVALENSLDLNFSELDLSLSSDSGAIPTSFQLYAPNLNIEQNKNAVGFNELNIDASASFDSSVYYNEKGKVDVSKLTFDNLKDSYKKLNVSLSSDTYGTIDPIESTFTGNVETTFTLDNFNYITITLDLNDNKLSKITDPLDISLAYQGPLSFNNDDLKMVEGQINLGDSMIANIVASTQKGILDGNIEANVELTQFNLLGINYFIDRYIPILDNYINEDTSVDGSLNFSGNLSDTAFLKSNGALNASIVANNLIFGQTPLNIGFNLDSDIKESSIDLSKLSIASFGYRLFVSGIYDDDTKIPNLSFDIAKIDSSNKLVTATMYQNEDDKMAFNILIPKVESFDFTGVLNNFNSKNINLNTNLAIDEDSYSLNVDIDLATYKITVGDDDSIDFNLQIGKAINASLVLKDFYIKSLDNSIINGNLSFDLNDISDWKFVASEVLLKYNEDKINVGFDALVDNNQISIDNLIYKNNSNTKSQSNSYTGNLKYKKNVKTDDMKFNPYTLNVSFGDGRDQNFDVVVLNKGFGSDLYIDVANVNFAPLLQLDDNLILNFRLIGNTNHDDTNIYRGSMSLYDKTVATSTEEVETKESNRNASDFLFRTLSLLPFVDVQSLESSEATTTINNVVSATNFSFESNIEVDGPVYKLASFDIKAGDLSVDNSTVSFDSLTKQLDLYSTISYLKHAKNTNQNSTGNLDFSLNVDSFVNNIIQLYKTSLTDEENKLDWTEILKKGSNFIKEKKINYSIFDGIYGSLKLDNLSVLKDTKVIEKLWVDTPLDKLQFTTIDSDFAVENEVVKIDGENLNGEIKLASKKANISLDKSFGIGVDADIDYSGSDVNLMLSNIYLPMNIISRILYLNTMKFYDGNIIGNLQITNLNSNPKYYGMLQVNKMKGKILYLQDQEVSLYNAEILAFGNELIARDVDFSVYNSDDNKTSRGTLTFYLDLIPGLTVGWGVDFHTDDYMKGIFPLLNQKVWSEGYAKDGLSITHKNQWTYINGNLVIKDAFVKGSLDYLPSWITTSSNYTVNIDLQTEDNVTVYYPDIDNPLLKATLEKDQNVNIYIDKKLDEMYGSGSVSIAQGELFYFQKNFFINSGKITLGKNTLTNKLSLALSLNATLKEFDSEGNSVDIIMTLNNSSLDNISPQFTSSPIKTQNEIVSILGESLTGSSSTENVQVSGLATAATSVFSSLGYINTGGTGSLNQVIASTLNLDIFSLNSNIVENLLLDTINIDTSSDNYSPIAKYLNNTSIYMGKYISNDSYLQLIINLLAESGSNSESFLASDLTIDLELTYDIDTPLAKFSIFTNPTELSIIDILDTIGLSITKSFQLR